MKVWIGGYRNHWTTQGAERWWYFRRYEKYDWEIEEDNRDLWDHAFETTMGLWRIIVCRPVNWIKGKIPRIEYIKIDRYDTWSMDSTLTPIILPMLKKLKVEKHGDPFTDDADVPEHLRSTAAAPKENEYDTDSLHSPRWDWIMDEMIWAFEQLNDEDNDEQFRTGVSDVMFQGIDANDNPVGEPHHLGEKPTIKNDSCLMYRLVDGPKHTMVTDYDAMKIHHARIGNGLRLFGVYFRALWD